jgi:hypothetical protein
MNSAMKIIGLPLLSLPLATVAHGQSTCAYDRPCVSEVFITRTHGLSATFRGEGWDVVHVRWSRPGRSGPQREYRGSNGTVSLLPRVTPGVVYTVSIQGCNRRFARSSECSGWHSATVLRR